MNAQDIETYLADLGVELGNLGVQQPIRILMVGGAYMLTQVGNRQTTRDIDILLEDIPDPGVSPLYGPFQAATRAVAAQHALPSNWINDVIGDALRNYGRRRKGRSGAAMGRWKCISPMPSISLR